MTQGEGRGSDTKFTIPGRLPDLNDHISAMNSHWSRGNKMKRENQETVCWAIMASSLRNKRFDKPVFINYYFFEPNRKRDQSNIEAFAVKVIEDALQQMGVIQNDNWKWMKGHAAYFDVDKENPRIEVEILEQ